MVAAGTGPAAGSRARASGYARPSTSPPRCGGRGHGGRQRGETSRAGVRHRRPLASGPDAGPARNPLTLQDEGEARRAHAELGQESFSFLLGGFEPDEPWAAYLARVEAQRLGHDLPAGQVASTFLAADVGGHLVGRASIRHQLNDFLFRLGGHIGYAVRPSWRRRGYATAILRQALLVTTELGGHGPRPANQANTDYRTLDRSKPIDFAARVTSRPQIRPHVFRTGPHVFRTDRRVQPVQTVEGRTPERPPTGVSPGQRPFLQRGG